MRTLTNQQIHAHLQHREPRAKKVFQIPSNTQDFLQSAGLPYIRLKEVTPGKIKGLSNIGKGIRRQGLGDKL